MSDRDIDSNRVIGNEILEGILEIKAYKAGENVLKTRKLPRTPSEKETRIPKNCQVSAASTE